MDKPNGIGTVGDALAQAQLRCEVLPRQQACMRWANLTFSGMPSTTFSPSQELCDKIWSDFGSFVLPHQVSEDGPKGGMLVEEELHDLDLGASSAQSLGAERWFFWGWFSRRRRTTETTTTTATTTTTTATTFTTTSTATTTTSTTTTTLVISHFCDRKRCNAEWGQHRLGNYHYIDNTAQHFKQELYSDGPFYTSFYVYEDFNWFFDNFVTTHAYTYQWGESLGGHAVVLVGWSGSCTCHEATGPSISRRRRTAVGPCWELRNSWGTGWADGGYFRMGLDMLTGPEGAHVHIASAAGDRVHSRRHASILQRAAASGPSTPGPAVRIDGGRFQR